MFSLSVENSAFIDPVSLNPNGTFRFNLEENHSGFYRLVITDSSRIDFVYDNENVDIATKRDLTLDNLEVICSESNKIYYEFVKINQDYKTKSELFQLVLSEYPRTDDFY